MKFNYFLLILLLNVIALNAAELPQQPEDVDYLAILNKAECQCYCSDLCGPRDKKVDDTPFYDEEFGVCFCKQRDKDNYLKNSCHLKPQDFKNCCGRPQEFKKSTNIQQQPNILQLQQQQQPNRAQQPTILPVNVPVK